MFETTHIHKTHPQNKYKHPSKKKKYCAELYSKQIVNFLRFSYDFAILFSV